MRVKLQFYSTVICLLGIALGFACKIWLPTMWFDGYIVILLFFYLIEMIVSFLLSKYEGKMSQTSLEGKTFVKKYLLIKLVKLFGALGIIGVYLTVMKDNPDGHQTEFTACAIFFYLINLAMETYIVGKHIKNESK